MNAADIGIILLPVAIRAVRLYDEGKAEPASDHAPIYLRKSQAERELEAKGKKLEE